MPIIEVINKLIALQYLEGVENSFMTNMSQISDKYSQYSDNFS